MFMTDLRFAGNPKNPDGGHISCEFHLFSLLCRFAFEHEWLAFLRVFALTWRLLCPFAFSCIFGTFDSSSNRYSTRGTTRTLRQDLELKLWEHFPLADIGRSTISCWGNLEEQSWSSQGTCCIWKSRHTSNRPISQYNRCKICWISNSRLPRPKLAWWNKQDTQRPQAKDTTSVVQNSWLTLKVQFYSTLSRVISPCYSARLLQSPILPS